MTSRSFFSLTFVLDLPTAVLHSHKIKGTRVLEYQGSYTQRPLGFGARVSFLHAPPHLNDKAICSVEQGVLGVHVVL